MTMVDEERSEQRWTAAGHLEEVIVETLGVLGLKQGGIVGLKKGGILNARLSIR